MNPSIELIDIHSIILNYIKNIHFSNTSYIIQYIKWKNINKLPKIEYNDGLDDYLKLMKNFNTTFMNDEIIELDN